MGSIIIGSGYRGLRFAKLICQMGEEVSAIVEKNLNMHNFIKWQLKRSGCPEISMFSDYREAFDRIPYEKADKVFIITPDFTHKEIFEECIKRNYHIFLEKPIATKRNDITDMIKLSENYRNDIQVGYVLRFTPFYKKIKEIITDGILGKTALIQMNERLTLQKGLGLKKSWHNKWANTGGFFNEKCSHDIDIMLWLKEYEAEPESIYSYGSTKFGTEPDNHPAKCSLCNLENCPYREEKDSLLEEFLEGHPEEKDKFASYYEKKDMCFFHTESEVFDNQTALITFSDGSHGTFSYVTVSGEPGRDIIIHGTKGCLTGNFDRGYLKYTVYETGKTEETVFDNTDRHAGGDEEIIRNFFDKTKNSVSDRNSLEECAKASLIAFTGDYSMYTGKLEKIPNPHIKEDFIDFEKYKENFGL